MADQDAAEGQEGFVDVQATLVTDPQPAELVQPTDRAFDDPTDLAQAAAVVSVSSWDAGGVGLPENYVPASIRVGGVMADSITGRDGVQGRGAAPSRSGGTPSDAANRAGG